MISANLRLAAKTAQSYVGSGVPLADLIGLSAPSDDASASTLLLFRPRERLFVLDVNDPGIQKFLTKWAAICIEIHQRELVTREAMAA